jgi:hypothetical protein
MSLYYVHIYFCIIILNKYVLRIPERSVCGTYGSCLNWQMWHMFFSCLEYLEFRLILKINKDLTSWASPNRDLSNSVFMAMTP